MCKPLQKAEMAGGDEMSKFLLLSDTHLGFSKNTCKLWSDYWDINIAPDLDGTDAIILAGDIASHETRQLDVAFRLFRSKWQGPILFVRGNHDYWDTGIKRLEYQIEKSSSICQRYGVTELQIYHSDGYQFEDCVVMGWDAWYAEHPARHTQDLSRIPRGSPEAHHLLTKRNTDGFVNILDELLKRPRFLPAVVVTHMHPHMEGGYIGSSASMWDRLEELGVHTICHGHTHRRKDTTTETGMRILNCGADYDKPNHMFFNVGGDTE